MPHHCLYHWQQLQLQYTALCLQRKASHFHCGRWQSSGLVSVYLSVCSVRHKLSVSHQGQHCGGQHITRLCSTLVCTLYTIVIIPLGSMTGHNNADGLISIFPSQWCRCASENEVLCHNIKICCPLTCSSLGFSQQQQKFLLAYCFRTHLQLEWWMDCQWEVAELSYDRISLPTEW